jgi:hypothetical protein
MRRSRFLFYGEWIVVAVLLALLLRTFFLRGWPSLQSEFPDYYLAAMLQRYGIPLDRAYEWAWFQRQNDRLGVGDGLVSFAPNPPSSVLPMVPLTLLPPLAAKRVWMVLNLVFLGASLWMLGSVTSLGWRRRALISLCCVVPLHFTFMYGRYYVLILLLLTGAYYASYHGAEITAGILLSAAAVLKLFPALCVILLIWKRNWRALAGFLAGTAVLLAISVFTFGIDVHRVFLDEVLSQAARGDWLAPYDLSRNTYISFWSHLFLVEPELNPSPLIDSSLLYALLQASTTTMLVFGFLIVVERDHVRPNAVHWAALIPLLLLASPTTGIDHACVLIFSAIVGFDVLLARGEEHKALLLLLLYVATSVPIPGRISNWFLIRLVATSALYVLLLRTTWAHRNLSSGRRWLVAGLIVFFALTILNLLAVNNRSEDFSKRLPNPADGYRAANPVPIAGGVAFTEMQHSGYGVVLLRAGHLTHLSLPGDALGVAGSEVSPVFYAELTGRQSIIVRLLTDRAGCISEVIGEGQEPVLSANGKWLAFVREDRQKRTVWLLATDSGAVPQMLLPGTADPIDVSVSSEGDVIASVGKLSDPHLVIILHGTKDVRAMPGFPDPARYPSISPDGMRVAFSRRDRGSWHLVVHDLRTGGEQQLTHASCNAISPSWQNAQTLLYATDCGRGVGLSAIARLVLPQ